MDTALVAVLFCCVFVWLAVLSTRLHQWIVDLQNRVHALERSGQQQPSSFGPYLGPMGPSVELRPGEPPSGICQFCNGLRIEHKPGCPAAPNPIPKPAPET